MYRQSAQVPSARTRMARIATLGSAVMFMGYFGFATINMFLYEPPETAQPNAIESTAPVTKGTSTAPETEAPAQTEIQAQQAHAYTLILQEQPHNRTALEGLATIRLAQGDYAGAIAPLETLVSLEPDRSDYAEQLATARAEANR